ncbi:MAG: SLATT domain-containing protein, partial [Chitinophagia bacterium]|nr:SLATT domain-containing protein [Chitinophagia bacterium]
DIPNTNITFMYDDEILYDEMDNNKNNNRESLDNTHESNKHDPVLNSPEQTRDDEYIKKIIDKTKNQSLNNGWNKRNELFIISIQLNCKHYKKMHELSAMNCNTVFNVMKIGLIIISTLLSVLTTYPNDQCGFTMNIIRFCLTYIVTLISILMHFFNYTHLTERHKTAACDFLKIHHDIKQQMCLYKRDRYIAFSYISKIIKQYDTLIMISPIIPSHILNKCKHEIEKCSDDMNDIIKTMSTVDIIDSNKTPSPQIRNNYFTSQNKNTEHMLKVESNLQNDEQDNSDSGSCLLQTRTESGSPEKSGESDPNSIQISVRNHVQNTKRVHVVHRDPDLSRTEWSHDPLLITGDIEDDEVNKCNSDQIKELRLKFFKANTSYEYLRFLRNEIE